MAARTPEAEDRAASREGSPRRRSVRAHLVGLVLAAFLPGVVVTVALFALEYRREEARRKEDTVAMARALSQAVDAKLERAFVLAQALATAGAIGQGDLAALGQRARGLLASTGVGHNVVLSDAAGHQVLNTLRAAGEPLPDHGDPAVLRRVFETGRPVISDLYTGGVLGTPVMSIDVPVLLEGRVAYDLSVGMLPEDFAAVLTAQSLPPTWVAAIFDSRGVIVARTHAPGRFVGRPGTPQYIERILAEREGTVSTVTREGIVVVSSFSRSRATGWSVGIGVPRGELLGGLQRSLVLLALGFGAVFVGGVAFAAMTAARIATSFRELVPQAAALRAGRLPVFGRYHVREAAEVAEALADAAARERAQDEANRELSQLARRDLLTGLQNRLAAEERLREEFSRLRRTGVAYVVLMMDIDHFKQVNDGFGHDVGDQVLRSFVRVVREALRESDFLARYGGEEFLALLAGSSVAGAMATAEKVRSRVAEAHFPEIGRALTVSIGVAVAQRGDAGPEQAVTRADAALYRAKQHGRDRVAVED